jgi:hypothetical protein
MGRSWDLVHPPLTAGIQSGSDDGPTVTVVAAPDSETSALLGAGWWAVHGGDRLRET